MMGKKGRSSKTKASARILIAVDVPIVRGALADLIEREADLSVVGQVDGGKEMLEAVEGARPDLVLMDYNPAGKGLYDIRKLTKGPGRHRTLVLGRESELILAERVIHAGAR